MFSPSFLINSRLELALLGGAKFNINGWVLIIGTQSTVKTMEQ